MIYRFDPFELDTATVELRRGGERIAVEPQVFALLVLLIENRDRLVTGDEIIAKVWQGRIVSDAAIASRIKSARQSIGDDGSQQRLIRTIHGRGFRFVGAVDDAPAHAQPLEQPIATPETGKPSIAVLPFTTIGAPGPASVIAEALPHDLITELSRLRWLFVIARESSFRLAAADRNTARAGAVLGVRYCLSGSLEIADKRITITVELADTRDGGVVWSDRYVTEAGGVHEVRLQIAASIVAALELRIPDHEAARARLTAPENLDAWSAYHLGLHHMFRFTRTDNAAALGLFERAIAREPAFARAHAGLSFAHFQNAFLHYTPDAPAEICAAHRHAERGLEIDALDPFVNFAMGRSFWLDGDLQGSVGWLDRAVSLSPNYAQGIYARAWADTLLCRGAEGQGHVDAAMALSPIDPLHYAMLGTRALSHLVRGQDHEAADWADRAARAPGAHILILVIASACHALAGDEARAKIWAEVAQKRRAGITQADFFGSFPFHDPAIRQRIATGLAASGI